MHWASHCEAFYAHWIVRYLHPRKSPWKQILSYWIQDEHIGSSIVIANSDKESILKLIPESAKYITRCLKAFFSLNLQQNTAILDHAVLAEPLWYNHRFHVQVQKLNRWKNTLHVHRLHDLVNDAQILHTKEQWKRCFDAANPNPHYKEWTYPLRDDLKVITRHTKDILQQTRPPPVIDGWVTIQVPKAIDPESSDMDTHHTIYANEKPPSKAQSTTRHS